MFNARSTFDAALATVSDGTFNPSNFSSKIADRAELMTACVYAEFIDAVRDSSLTRREKCAVSDEINPTIYGASPFDERKTIPVLQTSFPYLTKEQVAAIKLIVDAAV